MDGGTGLYKTLTRPAILTAYQPAGAILFLSAISNSFALSEKNISIVNEIGDQCMAFGDEGSTKIVLRNLIANAIKLTNPGGWVRLSSVAKGEYVNILVEDNGVGIPADKQPLLFGEGYFTSQGTNKEQGTGLGLLICKDLVQKNGGRLQFASTADNGSTFSFSLPAHRQLKCA